MHSRPPQGAVVACHGHGEEADGDGAGFGCLGGGVLVGWYVGGRGRGGVHFFAMGDGEFGCVWSLV